MLQSISSICDILIKQYETELLKIEIVDEKVDYLKTYFIEQYKSISEKIDFNEDLYCGDPDMDKIHGKVFHIQIDNFSHICAAKLE